MFNKKLKEELSFLKERNDQLTKLNRDLLDQADQLRDKISNKSKEISRLHLELKRIDKVREENHILFTNSLKHNEEKREAIKTLEARNAVLVEQLVEKDKEYNNVIDAIKSAIPANFSD